MWSNRHLSRGNPIASEAAESTTESRSTAWTSIPGKWWARNRGRLPPPTPMHTAHGRNSVLSAAVRHCRRSGLFWLWPITAAAAQHAHLVHFLVDVTSYHCVVIAMHWRLHCTNKDSAIASRALWFRPSTLSHLSVMHIAAVLRLPQTV